MTSEERVRTLTHLKESSSLYFSQRLAVQEEFELYCEKTNTRNCIMNFLAWLTTTPIGYDVIRALVKSSKEHESHKL